MFVILNIFLSLICQFSCVFLNTPLGDIQGRDADGPIYEFMGIPYAEPPIGNLRFAPAVPVTSFKGHSSTYDASTGYKNACVQPPTLVNPSTVAGFDEDCLQLNIWTPDTDIHAHLPVLVWIHGGSWNTGVAPHGENFVRNSGLQTVFVSMNYRLGILGFYSSTEISLTYGKGTGGMNGVLDQITAIQWVKDNIKYFGGNSDDITISGFSAGGVSVCPCSESRWGPISMLQGYEQMSLATQAVSFPSDLASLRLFPAETLNNALLFGRGTFFVAIGPSIDGYILKTHPDYLYKLLSYDPTILNANEIIWGFTNFDSLAGYSGTGFTLTDDNSRRTALELYISDSSVIDDIINTYYPSSVFVNQYIAWGQMESDICIACPIYNLAVTIDEQTLNCDSDSKNSKSSKSGKKSKNSNQVNQYLLSTLKLHIMRNFIVFICHRYEFRGTAPTYTAIHGSDFAFWLGINSSFLINWDKDLSDRMVNSLASFVEDGETDKEWNTFSKSKGSKNMNGRVFILDDIDPKMDNKWITNHRNGVCLFWDTIDRVTKYNLCNDGLSPLTEE